jgi:sugar lactone lactonase YvrE
MYDGGALFQIDPDGRRMRRIVMPVRCPTMPCFGGAGLDQLYVTSARADRSEVEIAAHPLSGGLFRLDVGAVGLAEAHWQRR